MAAGSSHYDSRSFLAALTTSPIGELRPAGVEVLRRGEVSGPLVGGCLTNLVSSLGTPYAFDPPPQAVLFLEDVGERPYRIRRMLTQLLQAGRFARVQSSHVRSARSTFIGPETRAVRRQT